MTETIRELKPGDTSPIKPEYMDSLYARIASGHIAHGLLLLGSKGSGEAGDGRAPDRRSHL